MKGGVAYPDLNETEVFTTLAQEHQSFLSVLVSRARNLRIVYNVWQSKDVKVSLELRLFVHFVIYLLSNTFLMIWFPNMMHRRQLTQQSVYRTNSF